MTLAVDQELLQTGYRQCAEITRRNGTTYYWGTQLLPRDRRRHVHAVYALCRLADDIVDDQVATAGREPAEIRADLFGFADDFRRAGRSGTSDPVLAAAAHTVRTVGIPQECFDRFFGAMAMDLTTTRYETWDDLLGYMEGSAAVIGEMMLPVLQPLGPEAVEPARALGFAFQYTNFLRDVAEDLDRGRIYLPQAELRRFGVTPVDLGRRRVTPQWRAFLAHEIERARGLYRVADRGLSWLPPRSARCVATARVLYSRILDRIEAADYDVFRVRARVPTWRKAGTAARILITGP